MAIIARTARRARSATSGSTCTSSTPSRRQRSRAAGVIIFMYRHTAFGLTGSQRTAGLARRSWCSMPVSVATSTAVALVLRAASSMPPVDSTLVRPAGRSPRPACHSAAVEHPHSGWMNSSASASAAALPAQVGRADARVHVALPEPDVHVGAAGGPLHVGAEELVGQEQDLLVGRAGTARSRTALADVQHTSASALTSALVLT